jgi:hypothetical protein
MSGLTCAVSTLMSMASCGRRGRRCEVMTMSPHEYQYHDRRFDFRYSFHAYWIDKGPAARKAKIVTAANCCCRHIDENRHLSVVFLCISIPTKNMTQSSEAKRKSIAQQDETFQPCQAVVLRIDRWLCVPKTIVYLRHRIGRSDSGMFS